MEVSREELAKNYRELSDEELLARVQAGTLTDLAMDVAASELRARGLKLPKTQSTEESAGADELDEETVDLVTVARFSNALKANVLRGCLEAHGIFAFIWGEHTEGHRFFSIPTGGVRVQVPDKQLAQAKEVMAAWERGELEIDDEPE
jgi:hypothetical protein